MAGLSSPGSEAAVSPGLVSSVTPVPASDVSQQSSDNESGGAKDENGQDIVCVVCNDKSSGKHYGQFTCEGRIFDLHCNTESALIMRMECMTFLSRARGKVPLLSMLPLC